MRNIDVKYTQQNPREVILLSATVFDSLDECRAVIGEKRCLEFINDAIIRKVKLDWNNRYCKELRNR